MAVKLVPAVCPQCGSKLKIPEKTKKVNCQFCGTEILLDKGEIVHIHKDDVEGKAERLLSVVEKYWDTQKFVEMRVACGQLLELDPDNPVGWLYNAISANAVGNVTEFERSMDEARKLSAKRMGSAEAKFFAQKVDWAYKNLADNMAQYISSGDMRNVEGVGHMMMWMKPESPLGWYYKAYAIAPPEVAYTKLVAPAVRAAQANAARTRAAERRMLIGKAWELYEKNPSEEFSKRFKEAVGKRVGELRMDNVKSFIGAVVLGFCMFIFAILAWLFLRGEDPFLLWGGIAFFLLCALMSGFGALASIWALLIKNERNFV